MQEPFPAGGSATAVICASPEPHWKNSFVGTKSNFPIRAWAKMGDWHGTSLLRAAKRARHAVARRVMLSDQRKEGDDRFLPRSERWVKCPPAACVKRGIRSSLNVPKVARDGHNRHRRPDVGSLALHRTTEDRRGGSAGVQAARGSQIPRLAVIGHRPARTPAIGGPTALAGLLRLPLFSELPGQVFITDLQLHFPAGNSRDGAQLLTGCF